MKLPRLGHETAFWWRIVAVAPAAAGIVAAAGYGIPHSAPLGDVLFLVLWSVVEEVVFRGGVQAALLRRTARCALGISAANALASLLFSVAHLWAHPAAVALGVLPVSLLLGVSFERSGERLAVPIALHLYFNLLLYAASAWVAR